MVKDQPRLLFYAACPTAQSSTIGHTKEEYMSEKKDGVEDWHVEYKGCLRKHDVTCLQKAGIAEPEETAVAGQWPC
jgi:hypothetical protein